MRLTMIVLLALVVGACSRSIVSPTPAPVTIAPTLITYTINVPDAHQAVQLQAQYPDGVQIPPIDAQHQWDYTAIYHGSPNVYFGETAPWQGYDCSGKPVPISEYMNTGIVVAPRAVAAVETFTARDWPNIGLSPDVTYGWLGRFAYAMSATFTASACPK